MALTQGFNPRPKIVFVQALAAQGSRAVARSSRLDLAEPVASRRGSFASSRRPRRPRAEVDRGRVGRRRPRPAQAVALQYALEVPAARCAATREALSALLASAHWPYTRHRPDRDRTVSLDLRPFVLGAELDPLGNLSFRLKMTPNGAARPEEVVDALGLRDLLGQGSVLVRTEMELAP